MAKSPSPPKNELDNGVSIGFEWSASGINLKAKSRFLTALDHMGANLTEKANAFLEKGTKLKRAKTAAEVKITEALGEHCVARIKNDPEFAERALNSHLQGIFKQQENVEAVLVETREQLKLAPPQEDKPDEPDKLDEQFLNRFHTYAKEASTEELRLQWAKVLASEVRKPGTFSNKVLRTIDEVDQETARSFQKFCENRISNFVPVHLCGKLEFMKTQDFVSAGLLIDPGARGQVVNLYQEDDNNDKIWCLALKNYAIIIPSTSANSAPKIDQNFTFNESKFCMKSYLLTNTGILITSIFEYDEFKQIDKLVQKFLELNPNLGVKIYQRQGDYFLPMV